MTTDIYSYVCRQLKTKFKILKCLLTALYFTVFIVGFYSFSAVVSDSIVFNCTHVFTHNLLYSYTFVCVCVCVYIYIYMCVCVCVWWPCRYRNFWQGHEWQILFITYYAVCWINPLNTELNPICYLLALLGAHHFLHVSRIRVKSLILRLQISHIYGAPILDVSRSHTTTQQSR